MGRATTKIDLINGANNNFEKLNTLIDSMTEKEFLTIFDFSKDEKKKEAHWIRDKNLRDIYIHLYEWHQLVINFVDANMKGEVKPFLPLPYNWKTYGKMNIMFWQNHQSTTLENAKELFIQSHQEVMNLISTFTSEELFSKNVFTWVGGSTLGSYFVSATSSHYDWAIKKIKAHLKNCKVAN